MQLFHNDYTNKLLQSCTDTGNPDRPDEYNIQKKKMEKKQEGKKVQTVTVFGFRPVQEVRGQEHGLSPASLFSIEMKPDVVRLFFLSALGSRGKQYVFHSSSL